jgi:hypothetical protein
MSVSSPIATNSTAGGGSSNYGIRRVTYGQDGATNMFPTGWPGANIYGKSCFEVHNLHGEGAQIGLEIGGWGVTSCVTEENSDFASGDGGSSSNYIHTAMQISNAFGMPTDISLRNISAKGDSMHPWVPRIRRTQVSIWPMEIRSPTQKPCRVGI